MLYQEAYPGGSEDAWKMVSAPQSLSGLKAPCGSNEKLASLLNLSQPQFVHVYACPGLEGRLAT